MWLIDVLATPAAVLLMAGRAARAGGHAVRGVAELSAPAAMSSVTLPRCLRRRPFSLRRSRVVARLETLTEFRRIWAG